MDTIFQASAEAVGATVKRFTTTDDAVAYLAELAAGEPVAASALPSDLRVALEGFAFAQPDSYPLTRTAVSYAHGGIAATGSLLIDLSDPADRGAAALASVHAVFLRASSIVADLGAAKEALETALSTPGRYISITSGPSRTADIERVLTIGVHGPKELHVLILEGA